MTLVLFIAIPLAGGLAAWLAAQWRTGLAKWIALAASLASLAYAVAFWAGHFANSTTTERWLQALDVQWIPQLGVRFHLALDGLSLIMILLTFAVSSLAVAASWKDKMIRPGFFHFTILCTSAGLAGAFMALDLILFYFFFEMMLVPLYFLVAFWGHENRARASVKFFIYTQVGALILLVGILGLYFMHGRAIGTYSFDYLELLGTSLAPGTGLLLMLAFFLGLGVKLPAFPLHGWLADAHTQAPTAGSVLLAGIVIKVGAYGMLRFMFPLFPDASGQLTQVGMGLGVAGILYGALLSFAQSDLKRMIAYTSVSHMGFVLLGIFAWNELALQGVVLQVVCHAFSTGGLFIVAGALDQRLGTRDMGRMGGLWSRLPRFGGVTMVLAMAALGLPALGNFVAEFLILLGAYRTSPIPAVIAAVGLVASTVYALALVQRVFHGSPARRPAAGGETPRDRKPPASSRAANVIELRAARSADLSLREIVMMAAISIVLLWLGLYPQPLIRTTGQTSGWLLDITSPAQASQGVEVAAPNPDEAESAGYRILRPAHDEVSVGPR